MNIVLSNWSLEPISMISKRLGLALLLLFALASCAERDRNQPKQRSLKDVENAIKVIKERQASEEGVVTEQLRQIEILKENQKNSRTDGMKEKIQRDIEIKTLAITKAKKNIANQSVILDQLGATRDSLIMLEGME